MKANSLDTVNDSVSDALYDNISDVWHGVELETLYDIAYNAFCIY